MRQVGPWRHEGCPRMLDGLSDIKYELHKSRKRPKHSGRTGRGGRGSVKTYWRSEIQGLPGGLYDLNLPTATEINSGI